MIYPLVRDLAAPGAPVRVPVAVTCRVLGFYAQAFYQWKRHPLSERDWDDAHLTNAAVGPFLLTLLIFVVVVRRGRT